MPLAWLLSEGDLCYDNLEPDSRLRFESSCPSYTQLQVRSTKHCLLQDGVAAGALSMCCDQYAFPQDRSYSLSTLWKVPSPPAASIHGIPGKCVLPGGRRGGFVRLGSQLPAPRQQPRATVQTIVWPAGNRGPEFCRSSRDPSLHSRAIYCCLS